MMPAVPVRRVVVVEHHVEPPVIDAEWRVIHDPHALTPWRDMAKIFALWLALAMAMLLALWAVSHG